jgi:MJ1316 RNA cyclic group end recognition domain
VGYLERFEGIKEMPMTMWVAESSDEDFIPKHRIKYFKRTSDGEVVWDREERIDKLFGSGLTGKVADGSGDDDEVLPAVQQQAAYPGR